jgi:hypothetical protein
MDTNTLKEETVAETVAKPHDDFADQSVEESAGGQGSATDTKLQLVAQALRGIQDNIGRLVKLLEDQGYVPTPAAHAMHHADPALMGHRRMPMGASGPVDGQVLEGVFDGQGMVGSDGKPYPVPPNYASKSKLVEGDMLKLTITPSGAFIFKQIAPVARTRVIGELGYDETAGEYYVSSGTQKWRVLKASVTYFRGEPGDQTVLLLPEGAPSKWAAVENIVKKEVVV